MDYEPLFESGLLERMPERPTPPPGFQAWLDCREPEPELHYANEVPATAEELRQARAEGHQFEPAECPS